MGAEWDDGTGQKIDWSLAVYVTPCSKSKELASNSPFHDHQLSFARRPKLFFGHYETTISFGKGIFFLYFNIFTLFIYYLFHHRDIEEFPSEKSLVHLGNALERFQVFQSQPLVRMEVLSNLRQEEGQPNLQNF